MIITKLAYFLKKLSLYCSPFLSHELGFAWVVATDLRGGHPPLAPLASFMLSFCVFSSRAVQPVLGTVSLVAATGLPRRPSPLSSVFLDDVGRVFTQIIPDICRFFMVFGFWFSSFLPGTVMSEEEAMGVRYGCEGLSLLGEEAGVVGSQQGASFSLLGRRPS